MSSIANKLNKFDKSHLPLPLYDIERKTDMFNAVLSLDTHEILQCNLMYKIPFTITDENKNSLIHILINNPSKSSELAKLSVIKFLINNGVDPDKPNKYNHTALHLACNQQLEKIVEYLLKNHANPNFKDNSGFTSFHYLLNGSINPVPPTELIDFIPSTNNVNFAKIELINNMKTYIIEQLELLKELPIFNTIQETIIAFISDDTEIKKIIQEFTNAQLVDLRSTDSIYSAGDTLQSEKIFETKITQRINNIFLVKPLKELIIHEKTPTSWVFSKGATGEYAFIKDGNISKSIKTTIKEQYNELITLAQKFTPYTIDLVDDDNIDIYKIIYYDMYIKEIISSIQTYMYKKQSKWGENRAYSHFRTEDPNNPPQNPPQKAKKKNTDRYSSSDIKKLFMNQDDKLRYKTASDNASSIINFKTLKYTGGPRYIRLGYNKINEYDIDNIGAEINEIIDKLINADQDNLINYMLQPKDDDQLINYDNNEELINSHMDIIKQNIETYLFLSKSAIKYKLNSENTITSDDTNFSKKWFSLWNDNKDFDLGAWIFNMWTDCSCRASRSNLIGHVSFKLLILINNLNDTTNIKASIFNSLKPHLISLFTKNYTDFISTTNSSDYSIILINIIIILLYDSDDFSDFSTIYNDITKIHKKYLIRMSNINYMYYLIQNYFIPGDITARENNIDLFIKNITTDVNIKTYYNTYKKKYDTFIDILCNMILDEYKQMSNKPLKQTILDFLYLLNKYNTDTRLDVFKPISIIDSLTNDDDILEPLKDIPPINNKIPNEIVLMPSHYGYLNVINSLQTTDPSLSPDPIKEKYNQIIKTHFIIAHILGLYYEGTLNMIDTATYINGLSKMSNKTKFMPGSIIPSDTGLVWFHTVYDTTNELRKYQVPLALQFTYINKNDFNKDEQTLVNKVKENIQRMKTILDNDNIKSIGNSYKNDPTYRIPFTQLGELFTIIEDILKLWKDNKANNPFIKYNNDFSPYSQYSQYSQIELQPIYDAINKFSNDRFDYFDNDFKLIKRIISDYTNANGVPSAFNTTDKDMGDLIDFMINFIIFINNNIIKNLEKKILPYNYNDYADFYNIYEKPIILPTTISYFIFLYDKIQYYQTLIKNIYNLINKEIYNFITGKKSNIKDVYTTYYFNIIILSKIIDNYYKSYKEVEAQLNSLSKTYPQIKVWLDSIPEINSNGSKLQLLENPIQYDQFAQLLNKINSSYYLYHYIFQPGNAIELGQFNFFQLPRKNEAIKYLYYASSIFMFDVLNEPTKLTEITKKVTTRDLHNIGLFNIYDIPDYTTSHEQYLNNPYLNNKSKKAIASSFVTNKKDSLPPSVYVNFDDFYKYTTIYLIINILGKIGKTNGFYITANTYIKKYIKPPESMIEIYTYYLISKIIEQLIINRYTTNIRDQIIKKKTEIKEMEIAGGADKNMQLINFEFLLAHLEKQTISITLNNSKQKVDNNTDLSNLYNLVIPPTTSSDDKIVFILYPNDLTNINKFKIKNGITIKTNIIKLLIDFGGIPYHLNMENLTPIDYLLKNYQIDTIKKLYETLKSHAISFYNSKNSIKYTIDDLSNMLGKIIPNIMTEYKLNSILLNFHEYLYQDIHQLILANNNYGNNEFICIPISFNISTYLILHYLKTTIDTDTTSAEHIYLYKQIDKLQIYKNINSLIADDVLSTKTKLLKTYTDYLNKLNNIKYLSKLEATHKSDVEEQINEINNEIIIIKSEIDKDKDPFAIDDIVIDPNSTLIEAYKSYNYNKVKSLKALKVWEKFFDTDFNITENYDMKLINLIIQQINILNTIDNNTNLQELNEISDKLKKISTIGEDYFTKPKFTKDNKTAAFIKEMLTYVATITFETSIFLLVKSILFQYFTEILDDSKTINEVIKYILKGKKDTSGKTFMETLIEQTIPDLVIIASNIYTDKKDEIQYDTKTSRQILLNLFAHLKEGEITLSEEILNIFDKSVVEYLDTFIVKTIEMWHVNAENIFKYFINNYRCLATLVCLIEHK